MNCSSTFWSLIESPSSSIIHLSLFQYSETKGFSWILCLSSGDIHVTLSSHLFVRLSITDVIFFTGLESFIPHTIGVSTSTFLGALLSRSSSVCIFGCFHSSSSTVCVCCPSISFSSVVLTPFHIVDPVSCVKLYQ